MDLRELALHIRPAAWLSLGVCLAFPPLWNAWLPRPTGEPITIALTPPRPDDALALPADSVAARLLDRERGVPGVRPPSLRFEFDLAAPGPYSVFGISSSEESRPLTLWIDGVRISAMAFFENTGSLREDFERHRIATGVALDSGSHNLKLAGAHLGRRSFALELRREAPLGPARFAWLFAAAGLALALRHWVVMRAPLTPGLRLAASLVFAVGFGSLPFLALAASSGSAFAAVERGDHRKRLRLAEFESYLASEEHQAREGRFSVALFGDSTHFWTHEPEHTMIPSVERALPGAERERFELYGIAAENFNPYDYYLLLNRVVEEAPDLVVVPINLRSFSSWWARLNDHDFRPVERYLRLEELLPAHGIAFGERELHWERILLSHGDALLGGHIPPFLRGVRRYARIESERVLEDASPPLLQRPAPARAVARAEPLPSQWPDALGPDDPLIRLLRRMGDLAARHGIRVLYYSVQTNVKAQARRGVQVDLPRRFAEIETLIAQRPNVSFLDLSHANPGWMFADDVDHLSIEGIKSVAGRLARAILALRDGRGV